MTNNGANECDYESFKQSARSEKELRQFLYFVILFNGVFCEMAVEFVPKEV
ncbi:hypothetical protein T06_13348 [Trichinella sp. T6]|nr:hypothetical protein T06_13348 [Trichinella sp. T6]